MFEEITAQYGLLGVLFTGLVAAIVYMAKRDEKRDAKLMEVVENNTAMMATVRETMRQCQYKGRT